MRRKQAQEEDKLEEKTSLRRSSRGRLSTNSTSSRRRQAREDNWWTTNLDHVFLASRLIDNAKNTVDLQFNKLPRGKQIRLDWRSVEFGIELKLLFLQNWNNLLFFSFLPQNTILNLLYVSQYNFLLLLFYVTFLAYVL